MQKPEDHLTLNAEDGEALIARVHRSNLPRADAERVEWVIRMYFYVVFRPAGSQTQCQTAAGLALWHEPRTIASAGGSGSFSPSGWRWAKRLCHARS